MSLDLEREIKGDDGLDYVMLLEGRMESTQRHPEGELMVTVTVTNWLPPVWTASMSLRSVSSFIKVCMPTCMSVTGICILYTVGRNMQVWSA